VGSSERVAGLNTKKPPTILKDGSVHWNDDDFNLDSLRVEALERQVFEMLAEVGRKPEEHPR